MLDATLPRDDEQVARFAHYLRETRAAIVREGIAGVNFENGVQQGDAIFLDQDYNIWRMARAGHPTRNRFHGIANLEQQAALIFGFYRDDRWAFTPGETVFVSNTNNGELTTAVDTGLIAGVAAQLDYLLIDSQISAAFGRLRDEIIAARGGFPSLADRLEASDLRLEAVEQALVLAKAGFASVAARFDSIDTAIQGKGSASGLNAVTTEVTNARSGQASLQAKISNMDTAHGSLAAEVVNARGSTGSLGAFLTAAHNPDGTLKSTITTSTWVQLAGVISRVNNNTFTVDQDVSFLTSHGPGRSLQCAGVVGIFALSVSYNGGTGISTVTTQGAALPNPLTDVYYGFDKSELPLYDHADLYGIDAMDETDTDPVKNKHVSNALMKKFNDAVDDLLDGTLPPLPSADTKGAAPSATLFQVLGGETDISMVHPQLMQIAQSLATPSVPTVEVPFTDPAQLEYLLW